MRYMNLALILVLRYKTRTLT